jgi:hypothetical protein
MLKIRKHSSDFLHFFGTFSLELYAEILSMPVMFIKFNANAQVHPRLDTFQKASSLTLKGLGVSLNSPNYQKVL